MTSKQKNCKIIDVHTHSGGIDISNFTKCKYPYCQDIIDLYEKGNNAGVSHQIVFSMPTTNYFDIPKYWKTGNFEASGYSQFPFEHENKHLVRSISSIFKTDKYFIPFLSFSLQDKIDEQQKNIVDLIGKYPFVSGIKYHTSSDQNQAMQLKSKSEIIDIAKEFNLSFMIHTGFSNCSDPMSVIEIAYKNPEVNFCAAHLGAFSKDFSNALDFYPYDNLFFDTSGLVPLCEFLQFNANQDVLELNYAQPVSVFKYYQERFPERILWGTDSPWYNAFPITDTSEYKIIRKYRDEVETLDNFDKEQILENTYRFLNKRLD